ncbi:ROK family protein [Amycolatopsis sp. NPDC101161]|uniref:ROK family transcriptional regulator n=1 Tax=Amycolatopsis sp. NPDC101161 TaxID=3363940 RepID=UPI00381867E8
MPTSAGELLQLVRSERATTRKALLTSTGLSRTTLTARLDQLLGAGLLAEDGHEDSTGGRPARHLRFDDGHAVVLAASIDTMHAEAAVTDLAGRRLAHRAGELRVADGPEAVLDRIAEWFEAMLAEVGRPGGGLQGHSPGEPRLAGQVPGGPGGVVRAGPGLAGARGGAVGGNPGSDGGPGGVAATGPGLVGGHGGAAADNPGSAGGPSGVAGVNPGSAGGQAGIAGAEPSSATRPRGAAGAGWPPVCGIGISVPGPVEPGRTCVTQPPIMPGWDGYPIDTHLGPRFGAPVLVDNDANLMALGEHRARYPDSPALVVVKASTGIGAGLVIGGEVYRGVDGGAGDIGHVRLPDHPEARCLCGSTGCLAAVAGGGALAARLTELGLPTTSGSGVRERILAGEPAAVRLAEEAGRQVGEVLATLVCVVNPGVLVVAGDLAEPHFVAGVREVLYRRALPRSTRNLRIEIGGRGQAIDGAVAMVVDAQFSPAAVDKRL